MTERRRRVFVSHSRYDDQGCRFIYDLFAGSDFEPDFYTRGHPAPPHAESLRDRVKGAHSLFIVLDPKMVDDPFTSAWVSYEAGMASAYKLPVVVVDRRQDPVEFQVPGATHYLMRPRSAAEKLPAEWEVVRNTACYLKPAEPMEAPGTPVWDVLTWLYNASMSDRDETGQFIRLRCQEPRCRTSFFTPYSLYQSERHPCPSCRNENASVWVKAMEFVEKTERDGATPSQGSRRRQ